MSAEQEESMPEVGSQLSEIFVSYSKEDEPRVKVLVAALEREGWNVFWDQERLPGDDWESSIGVHLDAAPVVIPVWSELSVKSRYVQSEVNRANKRKALVPVRIDRVENPFGFDHIPSADLVGWLADGGGTLPLALKSSLLQRMPPPNANAEDTRASVELEQARKARQEAEREVVKLRAQVAKLRAQIEMQRQSGDLLEALVNAIGRGDDTATLVFYQELTDANLEDSGRFLKAITQRNSALAYKVIVETRSIKPSLKTKITKFLQDAKVFS
jgi:hypothetical protein